jgi:CHAD domain-containing protein
VAGAREVKLDCEGSFSQAAARAVRVRSKEVFAQSEGVLDLGNVERVHDMRVATRRLRAALEIFEPCFPRKRHRKALKKVKALADALGERRDADVEIALLEGLVDEAAEVDRGALRDLIGELRMRQAEANESLAPYVAPKRLKKLRRRLKKLVKKAGS